MHSVAFILTMIGGVNWLLVGLFGNGIFEWLGMGGGAIAKIVYILVGLSALYLIFDHKKTCKLCDKMGAAPVTGNRPM